jgi:hypothetical protein
MNQSNVANDNYGMQADGFNTAAYAEASPWSDQVVALITASTKDRQFGLQGEAAAQFDVQGKSPMPSSEELTDVKIAAAEARTDTKIERLGGRIEVLTATIVTKIDSLKDDVSKSDQYNHDTRWVLISAIVVGIIALAGLLVALATYGDALFGRGMSVRDVAQTVIKEQQEIQKHDTTQPRR